MRADWPHGEMQGRQMEQAQQSLAARMTGFAGILAPRWPAFAFLALLSVAVAISLAPGPGAGLLAVLAVTFAALPLAARVLAARANPPAPDMAEAIAALIAHEPAPALLSDRVGLVRAANAAARAAFGHPAHLAEVFEGWIEGGSATIARLIEHARADGAIAERRTGFGLTLGPGGERRVMTHVGPSGRCDIQVQVVPGQGYLWRILPADAALRAEGESALPMLKADAAGAIVEMNSALRALLPRPIERLDQVLPDLRAGAGGCHVSMATARGRKRFRIIDLPGAGGLRELHFAPEDRLETVSAPLSGGELLDNLPVAVLRVGPRGEVLMANRTARQLLDHPMNGQVAFASLVEGPGRPVGDWLEDVFAGRGLHRAEVVRALRTGPDLFVQVTVERVVSDGEVSLVVVMWDATAHKSLEAQFVQSQKMQAIGQLAGGIAHDFNNLLTAISGHCDLLMLRHDDGDPEYGDLVQIHQNANRAAALVGQLLAFSRKQNLHPEVLDLRDCLSELTHLLNRLVGERVRLVLDHDPALAPILADRRQLEQVIVNLVVNARDALDGAGEICIELANRTLAAPLRRDRAEVPAGDYVVLRVRDAGCGIPADRLEKIFEPFFTTKRPGEGTGLGLSTAYGIVKQTGGFIFVDSIEGQGTEFTIFFPAHDRPEPSRKRSAQRQRRLLPPGEGRVLLVEDEAPVRAFASRALRLRGFTVIEAESAEAALEALADPTFEVDLFVSDVIMPGLDGPSWVSRARAMPRHANVPVVFISGYAEDAFGGQNALPENARFLQKPFSLNDLTAVVQESLG